MGIYLIPFLSLIVVGLLYTVFVQPKRWMKMYGDGNYSPLRRVYANSSKKIQSELKERV